MMLSAMTYETYQLTNRSKALDTDALKVLTKLREARALTLASKNDAQWGVHLASSSITLFEGASYDAGDASNVNINLNPLVTLATITLEGGGSDVVFDRLTGSTPQSGTTTLSLIASSTMTRTIVIYETGVVEM